MHAQERGYCARANSIEMMYKLVAAAIVASVSAVKVGDMVPDVNLDYGFPPEKINLYQRVMGKKVILMSLPGAFTPT